MIRKCHKDGFTFPVAVCVYCHGAWPDGRLHHGGILGDPGWLAQEDGTLVVWEDVV